MVRVVILALEQSFPSGILVIHDLFRMAELSRKNEGPPLFDVRILSEKGRRLTYSGFCSIQPHGPVAGADPADLVIVPSGGYKASKLNGYSKGLIRYIASQAERGGGLAGICTGVFLLAESGVLTGKKATTHWAYASLFRERYPDVDLRPDQMITEDGQVFCSGGGSAGVDLGLYLIEKYQGPEPARRCSAMMLLDRGREAQTPYRETLIRPSHSDGDILKAQAFIEGHLAEDFVMDEVAAHVNMSLRNFKRRFKNATGEAPLAHLQRLRVDRARQILEQGDIRIDDLAGRVGYEDLGFFRKVFARYTGVSPSDYRHRFRSRFAGNGSEAA